MLAMPRFVKHTVRRANGPLRILGMRPRPETRSFFSFSGLNGANCIFETGASIKDITFMPGLPIKPAYYKIDLDFNHTPPRVVGLS